MWSLTADDDGLGVFPSLFADKKSLRLTEESLLSI